MISWVSETFYSFLNIIHINTWRAEHSARQQQRWEADRIRGHPHTCRSLIEPVEEILYDLEEQDLCVEGPTTGWQRIGADNRVQHQFRYQLYHRAIQEAYQTSYRITSDHDSLFRIEAAISVDADRQRPFFMCRNWDYITTTDQEVSGETVDEFRYVLGGFLEPYIRHNVQSARRNWHNQFCRAQLAALRAARRRAARANDDARHYLPLILANTTSPANFSFTDLAGHTRDVLQTLTSIAYFLNVETPHLVNYADNHGAERIRRNALAYADLVRQALEEIISDRWLRREPIYREFIRAFADLDRYLGQIAELARTIYCVSPA